MKQHHRTPKSVYLTLAAGIAVGATVMAGVQNGVGVRPAIAQPTAAKLAGELTSENLEALHSLDNSMANLAEFASPAVVHLRSVTQRKAGADGIRMPMTGGQGSGFIFRPDGWIVTNDHVVGGFDKVTAILKDGREFAGKVVRAEDSDIALVKIEAAGLPTLAFGDSEKVRPGQVSMAIGAPFGLEQSVTVGHISALARMSEIDGKLYPDLIQTDTSINVGNSGGPLLNVDGQVIGINTAIFSPTGVSGGIGFAIPSNQARLIADILMKDGKLTRSMMKLIPENLKDFEKKELGLDGGARVTQVTSDGPAAAAGLKDGDVITRIGETKIHDQLDLRNAMLEYRPGTTVEVEYVRKGKRETTKLKLVPYEKPAAPAGPMSPFGGDGRRIPLPEDMKDLEDWFKDMPGLPKNHPDVTPDPGLGEKDVPPIGKARLGITVETATPELRKRHNIPDGVEGAVVTSVQPNSVAARTGFQVGDIVTAFGDRPVRSAQDLISRMEGVNWGDKRAVAFARYGADSRMERKQDVLFQR